MTREEARNLIGGYASGNLTPEQESALLAVALEDQELFDALMAEQPLKELLDDPSVRRDLLAALDEAEEKVRVPWWRRPMAWALAGSLAAGLVTVGVLTRPAGTGNRPLIMAKRDQQPDQQVAAPVAPKSEPLPSTPSPIPAPAQDVQPVKPLLVVPPPKQKKEAPVEQPVIAAQKVTSTEAPKEKTDTRMAPVPAPAPPAVIADRAVAENTTPGTPALAARLAEAQLPPAASAPAAPPVSAARQLYMGPSSFLPQGSAAGSGPGAPIEGMRAAIPMTATRRAKLAAPAVMSAGAPLGLRFNVQQLNTSGGYETVNPAKVFQPTDVVRLQVQSNSASYIWVLQREGTGWRYLLQSDESPLTARTDYLAPVHMAAGEQSVVLVRSNTLLTHAQVEQAANAGPTRGAVVDDTKMAADAAYVVSTAATPLVYGLKLSVR